MKGRFIYTLVVGIIVWICILIFGKAGSASMALLAGLIFYRKKKYDEREYQLYYKTNNFAFAIMIIAMVIIDQLAIHGNVIMQENWLILSIAGFFIGQGLFGLILFNRE
jgi:hypothetical protein